MVPSGRKLTIPLSDAYTITLALMYSGISPCDRSVVTSFVSGGVSPSLLAMQLLSVTPLFIVGGGVSMRLIGVSPNTSGCVE